MLFSKCFLGWVRNPTQTHDDVYMKLFSLSLEEYACEWYLGIDDNSYATYDNFLEGLRKDGEFRKSITIN